MTGTKVGLALGGGAARGWAHIGVLKAFQEEGIPTEVVAGTSIGSIVGACFAAGKIDELESFARSIDIGRMLKLTDLKFHGRGLFEGAPILEEFSRQLSVTDIEDLNMPFAAVAVDLVTSEEVVFTKGKLLEAVRASISLPGIFTPVQKGEQFLVDGGLRNPLPVSVARQIGADFVIAVDILGDHEGRIAAAGIGTAAQRAKSAPSSRLFEVWGTAFENMTRSILKNTGPNIIETLTASTGITMKSLTEANLRSAPANFIVQPKIGHITMIEFNRADEMIAAGYEAGMSAAPKIKAELATFVAG